MKGAGIPGMKSNVVNSPTRRVKEACNRNKSSNVEKQDYRKKATKGFASILFIYQVVLASQISSDGSSTEVCLQY